MKRKRHVLGVVSAGVVACVGGCLVLHNAPFQALNDNTNSLGGALSSVPSKAIDSINAMRGAGAPSGIKAASESNSNPVTATASVAGQVQDWQQQLHQQVQQVQQVWQQNFQQQAQQVWQQNFQPQAQQIWQQQLQQQNFRQQVQQIRQQNFQQQVQQIWQQQFSGQWQQQLQQWIQQLQQQLVEGQSVTTWPESSISQSQGTVPGGSQSVSSSPSTSSTQSTPAAPSAVSMPANTQQSGNWAGYIDMPASNSNAFTSVSGTWQVPSISGSKSGAAAQWIGLGGVNSQDLLQMGTIEDFENGQAVANIFWEKLPASAQMVMSVPIGSTISATIEQASSTTWNLKFKAQTPSRQTISKTIPVTVSSAYAQEMGTSAEWISEDPSNGQNQLLPLANMGTVNYTNATVDGQALSSSENQVIPVALIDNYGDVLVAPSSISSDGASFSTQTLTTGLSSMPQGVRRGGGHSFIPGGRYGYGGDGASGYGYSSNGYGYDSSGGYGYGGYGYGHYGRHGR